MEEEQEAKIVIKDEEWEWDKSGINQWKMKEKKKKKKIFFLVKSSNSNYYKTLVLFTSLLFTFYSQFSMKVSNFI